MSTHGRSGRDGRPTARKVGAGPADVTDMAASLLQHGPCFIRQRVLGSEAVYEVISEHGATVTAEVVAAPGLERGTQLRILARAARAMERLDLDQLPATRRFDPAQYGSAPALR